MGQTFGITTLDSLFKWVLGADSGSEWIRSSFFHAFIPDVNILSSTRIDDHMKPLKELQILRHMVNHNDTTEMVNFLKKQENSVKVHVDESCHEGATKFLKSLLQYFDDIQQSFPEARFDGRMDFVCELGTGELAIVEMQISPESHWDQRALAYVAAIYGNQLRRKSLWKDIQKVIGINLLGGGIRDEKHWPDAPDQFVRHYKIQEQLHNEIPPRFLEGIEIFQYSLSNAPPKADTQEKQDWLCFFRNAHRMSEEDVQRIIKTPAVLEAFERAKLISLPQQVKHNYTIEENAYTNLSDYIEKERSEGLAKGIEKGREEGLAKGIEKGREEGLAEGFEKGREESKREMARNFLKNGVELAVIAKAMNLSEEEIRSLLV